VGEVVQGAILMKLVLMLSLVGVEVVEVVAIPVQPRAILEEVRYLAQEAEGVLVVPDWVLVLQ
jgi:hypothetical protein